MFIVLILVIFRVPIMEKIGGVLVYQDELKPSDAIVVLTGSRTGDRIEEAVRVFNEGMGKVIIFSGYSYYPGMDSNIGMKNYAIQLGVQEEKIITEKSDEENSTWGEAISNLKQLERLQAKSFILVTSNFHTRRSHWVYERAIQKLQLDITFRVQPSPDPETPFPDWWEARTGQKNVFNEYIKFLYYFISY